MIKRNPYMPNEAFGGPFHIVNDKTGMSLESHATLENAQEAMSWLDEHERRCAEDREKYPHLRRRERETYRIEEEK